MDRYLLFLCLLFLLSSSQDMAAAIKCKHKKQQQKCKKYFEEKWGKPDKDGKRSGFLAIGEKTGGKW